MCLTQDNPEFLCIFVWVIRLKAFAKEDAQLHFCLKQSQIKEKITKTINWKWNPPRSSSAIKFACQPGLLSCSCFCVPGCHSLRQRKMPCLFTQCPFWRCSLYFYFLVFDFNLCFDHRSFLGSFEKNEKQELPLSYDKMETPRETKSIPSRFSL